MGLNGLAPRLEGRAIPLAQGAVAASGGDHLAIGGAGNRGDSTSVGVVDLPGGGAVGVPKPQGAVVAAREKGLPPSRKVNRLYRPRMGLNGFPEGGPIGHGPAFYGAVGVAAG